MKMTPYMVSFASSFLIWATANTRIDGQTAVAPKMMTLPQKNAPDNDARDDGCVNNVGLKNRSPDDGDTEEDTQQSNRNRRGCR